MNNAWQFNANNCRVGAGVFFTPNPTGHMRLGWGRRYLQSGAWPGPAGAVCHAGGEFQHEGST